MIQLSELLGLFETKNEVEWRGTLLTLAMQLGFQHTLFGIVPDKSQPLESAFLVSNYPDDWRATYDKQHMHKVDPTVSHCLSSALPIVWKSETFHGGEQNEFYEQASGFGLRSGITLPMHGNAKEFGMLSFVSGDDDHAARGTHMESLAAMSLLRDYALESSRKYIHSAGSALPKIKLTNSELECLKWVTAGKSSWEVSRILSRSEATVNFHIANIMKKFDVQTRQQAVIKAIKYGVVIPA